MDVTKINCSRCGHPIFFDTDIYEIVVKEEAWKKAHDHLFDVIVSEFEKSRHGVVTALVGLKKRFDKGERTYELYREMMDMR